MTAKARILCVDDEARVLLGLSVLLRREFDVVTAESPLAAVELLTPNSDFAVVVSDMRMPGMNGAELLYEASRRTPNTSRILLSGQTDLDAAMLTVNRAGVFRILRKPCDHNALLEALRAGVVQHARLNAERELLERTLVGTVGLLMDVLALTNPPAFGHANQIRRHVMLLAGATRFPNAWELEVAAMLLQLGAVVLSPATIDKLYRGETLTAEEGAALARGPQLVEELFNAVPRLEGVKELLGCYQNAREIVPTGTVALPAERRVLGAGILRLAHDFERLEWRGLTREQVFDLLRTKPHGYALELVDLFRNALAVRESSQVLEELALNRLLPGMILAEDLRTRNGVLVARRGHQINSSFVENVRASHYADIVEPIRVIVGRRPDERAA